MSRSAAATESRSGGKSALSVTIEASIRQPGEKIGVGLHFKQPAQGV